MKFLTLSGSMIFSYVGWYLGAPLGFGWAFVISSVGALVGVYVGWKLGRHFGL